MIKKLLAVIDMQNDFVDGALGTPEAQAIVPKVVEKIKTSKNTAVCTTYDTHGSDYMDTLEGKKLPVPHCNPTTDGWSLNQKVKDALEGLNAKGEPIEWFGLSKHTFGTLEWEYILNDDKLKDIEEIEICGLCTDICVISNALILRAMRPNMKIVIDHTACAGVTPEKHEAALKVAESCQIDVI